MFAARRSTRLRLLRATKPRTPIAARQYAAATSSKLAPMPQMKELESSSDIPPPYIQNLPPSSSSSPQASSSKEYIQLPQYLPTDRATDNTALHHAFYPSSSFLDSISMITMCLRRQEHVPRAYQIFQSLLKHVDANRCAIPDADLFGKVADGCASLITAAKGGKDKWEARSTSIVRRWEDYRGRGPGEAYLGQDGMKVYAGWLTGAVKAGAKLDFLAQYFESRALTADGLMEYVPAENATVVLEALLELATTNGMHKLADSVETMIRARSGEASSREPIQELDPVKQNAYKAEDMERDTARFDVINLRQALSSMDKNVDPLIRQRNLEEGSLEASRIDLENSARILSREAQSTMTLKRDQLQAWMYDWVQKLTQKLESEMEIMQQRIAEDDRSLDLPPRRRPTTFQSHRTTLPDETLLLYLQLLPVDKLALVGVTETMRAFAISPLVEGAKAVAAMTGIGKAIETEYQATTMRSVLGKNSKKWNKLEEEIAQGGNATSTRAVNQAWRKLGQNLDQSEAFGPLKDVWAPSWAHHTHMELGGWLLDQVLRSATVTRSVTDPLTGEEVSEEQPAFTHRYEYVRGHKLGMIQCNPVVGHRLGTDTVRAMLPPKFLPMLVKPRPWTDHDVGGYLLHRVTIMRHKDSQEQAAYLKQAIATKNSEPILHGLDVLSSTPWTINKRVFDVMFKVWQDGDKVASIPASEDKAVYDFPAEPDYSTNHDPAARTKYFDEMKYVRLQQRKDHAERCRINYSLEVANKFRDEVFYLPHNMDFRGRAYPIPPHLSPVGDDLNRGLLKFAEKRPLGTSGLKWLRIHLANVYGYDKLSFGERERFAQDHEKEIFDSAERPLDGARWWLKAEDPWQCLATCMELHSALTSPDPTQFESSLPVHQDGTCNGMQHYAALGGDVRGAKAVNLENGDRPADIYSRVVEIVNRVIKQDQANGNPQALLIKEPLQRKIVKQTVMTTVYGVTFIGARDQISRQLVSRMDLNKRDLFAVSSYIAKVVLSCIGDLFSGAKDIQDWLTTSARLISKSIPAPRLKDAVDRVTHLKGVPAARNVKRMQKELMSSVIWTTPLGLPIVQPYRKPKRRQIMTALQSVYVTDPMQAQEVSPNKQATAFPPNFVHSLDATHMFLTALKCSEDGITFASVHDSYWTHASTVDPMSDRIRDAFIDLHSADIIGTLREEMLTRYADNYIHITNARQISRSSVHKQAMEEERRAKVRAIMGDESAPNVDVDSETSVVIQATADVMGEEPDDIEILAEKEAANDEAAKQLLETKIQDVEATLGSKVQRVAGHLFVKLVDILPPAPQRGKFDVKRIKDSRYFFS